MNNTPYSWRIISIQLGLGVVSGHACENFGKDIGQCADSLQIPTVA